MSSRATIVCVVVLTASSGALAESPDADEAWEHAAERGEYAVALEDIEQRLRRNPDSVPLRFARARVLAWSGDLVEAAACYRALIAIGPENADYALGYAQVMAWMGSDELAVAELARARQLAPEYEAIWLLEARVLSRLPDRADDLELLRQRAAERFPGSTWWRASRPSPRPPVFRVDVGARADSISTGADDWQSRYLRLSRAGNRVADLYAGVRRESRFGLDDTLIDIGGSWRATERWAAGLDVSFGRDPDFSPERGATLWVSRSWVSGWEAGARIRASDYRASSVSGVALSAARYLGDFRFGYSFIPTQLSDGAPATTHVAMLDYYRSERSTLRLTVATGEEVEAVAPGTLARTDVRSLALMFRHTMTARWDLTWHVGSHRQGDLYRRQFLAVSVSARL
jgi:YaiO family outer membrane protein